MLAKCIRKMWFVLYSFSQPCNLFGNTDPDLFAVVLWTLWNRRNNLHLGKPALPLGQVVAFAQDLIEVEVLVAQRALELTLELGFDNITLGGNSKVLFKSLETGCNSLAHYGHLAEDIQILISQFSSLSLSHVRRHCNRLAHALARRASSTPVMSIRMEEISPDLNSVYMADLNGLS
ncbi:hypothetical protein SO802_002792 [Lithocarpus litseifolius]|uniref:RNase H type-1 domain-containing protein n=1 Tax=Lithocarpus litseifolius TaxID=425828 RepID=A0AAW2DYI9_9ROSI